MSSPPRRLSQALPELFRVRGGPVLAEVLAAIDAEWERHWQTALLPTTAALASRARRLGYGSVLAVVGSLENIAAPQMLAELPLRGGGPDRAAEFWLACLFGARLVRRTMIQSAAPDVPLRATATVAGDHGRVSPDSSKTRNRLDDCHKERVHRVLRLIWPAHWLFEPRDLIWEERGEK
jgi:hypothetical protein